MTTIRLARLLISLRTFIHIWRSYLINRFVSGQVSRRAASGNLEVGPQSLPTSDFAGAKARPIKFPPSGTTKVRALIRTNSI